jgi:hypothetical protein
MVRLSSFPIRHISEQLSRLAFEHTAKAVKSSLIYSLELFIPQTHARIISHPQS